MIKLLKKDLTAEQIIKADKLIKGGLLMNTESELIFFCAWDKKTFLTYG
jgi:hypothetical protein